MALCRVALLARHTAHMPSTHATPATRSHTHRNSSCTKVSGRTSKTVITARHVLQSCADMVKPLAPGQLAMPICRATLQARGPPRPSYGKRQVTLGLVTLTELANRHGRLSISGNMADKCALVRAPWLGERPVRGNTQHEHRSNV